jgi:WD40 repeat protein
MTTTRPSRPTPRPASPLEWRAKHVFKTGKEQPCWVSLSPDGKLIAAGSVDAVGWVWDTSTGKRVARLGDGNEAAQLVQFAPDGRTLALYSGSGIVLFDLPKKEIIRTLKPRPEFGIDRLRFSPDGKLLGAAAREGGVDLWVVETGKMVGHFLPELEVGELAFSPDGETLAVAVRPNRKAQTAEAKDSAVRLLDVVTGKVVRRLSHA